MAEKTGLRKSNQKMAELFSNQRDFGCAQNLKLNGSSIAYIYILSSKMSTHSWIPNMAGCKWARTREGLKLVRGCESMGPLSVSRRQSPPRIRRPRWSVGRDRGGCPCRGAVGAAAPPPPHRYVAKSVGSLWFYSRAGWSTDFFTDVEFSTPNKLCTTITNKIWLQGERKCGKKLVYFRRKATKKTSSKKNLNP